MANRSTLQKRLSYRLPDDGQSGYGNVDSMASHWNGFEWRCGPVVVKWLSDSFPQVQVWAASEEEGKRVVRHALAHMDAPEEAGEWQVSVCSSNRYGRIATVRATIVTARNGPSGANPTRWLL